MAELLLELLSEEIPAGMQGPAADQLRRHVVVALDEADIGYANAKTHWGARRLALVVDGLATMQADRTIERKGPRTNAPEKAIQGFLGATGVSLEECEVREDKKGAYYGHQFSLGTAAPQYSGDIRRRAARRRYQSGRW